MAPHRNLQRRQIQPAHPSLGPARQRMRGLTLVEMLVALVILAFMLTLVSQAVQQVSQLVRAAETTTRAITGGWAGAWSLQPTLSNLVWPVEKQDDGFKGTPARIEGFSNTPINGTTVGLQAFTLELRRSSTTPDLTEVWATSDGARPGEPSTQLVARLDGRVAFAFADKTGAKSPVWPLLTRNAATAEEVTLPEAVMLLNLDNDSLLMRFGFEGEKLRPRPPSKAFFE